MMVSTRNLLFQGSIFRGKLLVSGIIYVFLLFTMDLGVNQGGFCWIPTQNLQWKLLRGTIIQKSCNLQKKFDPHVFVFFGELTNLGRGCVISRNICQSNLSRTKSSNYNHLRVCARSLQDHPVCVCVREHLGTRSGGFFVIFWNFHPEEMRKLFNPIWRTALLFLQLGGNRPPNLGGFWKFI